MWSLKRFTIKSCCSIDILCSYHEFGEIYPPPPPPPKWNVREAEIKFPKREKKNKKTPSKHCLATQSKPRRTQPCSGIVSFATGKPTDARVITCPTDKINSQSSYNWSLVLTQVNRALFSTNYIFVKSRFFSAHVQWEVEEGGGQIIWIFRQKYMYFSVVYSTRDITLDKGHNSWLSCFRAASGIQLEHWFVCSTDSAEERVAVRRANQMGSARRDVYQEGPKV